MSSWIADYIEEIDERNKLSGTKFQSNRFKDFPDWLNKGLR